MRNHFSRHFFTGIFARDEAADFYQSSLNGVVVKAVIIADVFIYGLSHDFFEELKKVMEILISQLGCNVFKRQVRIIDQILGAMHLYHRDQLGIAQGGFFAEQIA